MRRLGYASSLVTSGSRGWAEYVGDEGVPIRSANLQRNSIQPNLKELVAVALPKRGRGGAALAYLHGDVLIGITGANTGWVALAHAELIGGNVSQHVCPLYARWQIGCAGNG